MQHSKPVPIKLCFKDIRLARQSNNNYIVYQSLLNRDMDTLHKNINMKEFERTLNDLDWNETKFVSKCVCHPDFAKLAARLISKCASRQGSKDEGEQLRTCNLTAKACGIKIENLTATQWRPTKSGSIISNHEMITQSIGSDDCLKSFDGRISGKLNGFISAKVAYGSGGHQDNVFVEMHTLANWWKRYKCDSQEVLVILIDTDLTDKINNLKEKNADVNNVNIFNHVEFQQYMINKYYDDSI